MKVSIEEVIVNNYKEIKDKTYDWEKEELEAFYRLIESRLYRFHIDKELRDDLKGQIMLRIFSNVIDRIDITKPKAISTYIVASIDNEIKNYIRGNMNKGKEISFDAFESDKEWSEQKLFMLDRIADDDIDLRVSKKVQEYEEELKKIAMEFDCVKLCYIDKLDHGEIAKIFNVSRSNVSDRVGFQLDAIKMILMTKGYTSDFFTKYFGYTGFSDEYKYCEALIEKRGLIYLVYNQKTDRKDIIDALNMDPRSVTHALNYLKDMKAKHLEENNVNGAKGYVDFAKYFLPQTLYNIEQADKNYFSFIDKIMENNEYVRLRFKEGKSINEIAKEKQLDKQYVANRYIALKPKVIRDYKEYLFKNKSIINKK